MKNATDGVSKIILKSKRKISCFRRNAITAISNVIKSTNFKTFCLE